MKPKASPSHYSFKIADQVSEIEQIFELNYATFVEEIPQHEQNDSARLVDKFHDQNTYLICLKGDRLIGMMALRDQRPFSLDSKIPDLDSHLPADRNIVEIRLLSVVPNARTGRVLQGLLSLLAEHNLVKHWDLAVISATTRQQKLYQHIGFTAFGPLVGSEGAYYQPMYVELESFESSVGSLLKKRNTPSNFLPGPVGIHDDVVTAFTQPAASHRSEAVKERISECCEKLRQLTGAGNVAIAMGSGTLANEMVAAQLSQLSGRGLIVSNGEFGERLADQAQRWALPFDHICLDWGKPFNPKQIESVLEDPHDWLWLTACETSTGMKNPVQEIQQLCQKFDTKLCIDAVSAIGAYPLNLEDIYLASGASGKSIASYPGLAFVCHNHQITPGESIPSYLDVGRYHKSEQMPFTQSSNLIEALHAALLVTKDWQARFSETEAQAAELHDLLNSAQIPTLVTKDLSSPAVVTIPVPKGKDSRAIAKQLAQQGLLVASESEYLIERNWIQICLMSRNLRPNAIPKLVTALQTQWPKS